MHSRMYILLLLHFLRADLSFATARSRERDSSATITFHQGSHTEAARAAFQVYLPAWWATKQKEWAPSQLPDAKASVGYHSQDGQDQHAVHKYFYGKSNLFYIEMGGLDGVFLSNTLYLQQALGWRGLLVEPNPTMYPKMVTNRPHDLGVNAAICDKFQDVHFIDAPEVGGIVEFMPDAFKEQFSSNHANANTTVIPCLPLSSILAKLGITHIDFWSLDVESAELKVLETFDWRAASVDVLVVEANGHDDAKDQAVIDLLVSQDFVHDGKIVRDNWFHHKTFRPSVLAQS